MEIFSSLGNVLGKVAVSNIHSKIDKTELGREEVLLEVHLYTICYIYYLLLQISVPPKFTRLKLQKFITL